MTISKTKNKSLQVAPYLNKISGQIVDAAYQVHFNLGPGLLESVYETCLVHKLTQKGFKVDKQISLPILFEDIRLEGGLRLDLIVEEKVIVEIKAVDALLPIHDAQLLAYLKLSGMELGLLINFNVPVLKKGLKRLVYSKDR